MSDTSKLEEAADGGLRLTACSPSSIERGPAKAVMDERDMEVIRGMVQALAGYTYATPNLIVRHLTGVLWTQREAEQICPENT